MFPQTQAIVDPFPTASPYYINSRKLACSLAAKKKASKQKAEESTPVSEPTPKSTVKPAAKSPVSTSTPKRSTTSTNSPKKPKKTSFTNNWNSHREDSTKTFIPPPKAFKKYLDQYSIGQDRAKKHFSVAIYNHYVRLQDKLDREREIDERKAEALRMLEEMQEKYVFEEEEGEMFENENQAKNSAFGGYQNGNINRHDYFYAEGECQAYNYFSWYFFLFSC